MNQNLTFVLLHGAGTGPWVWTNLQGVLQQPSITCPINSRHKTATPESCAEDICQRIDKEGLNNVVLVLHSLAGVLAVDLASFLGKRLLRTVFVSAVIPSEGKCFMDALGFPNSLILRILFRLNPEGIKPSETMLRKELCNDLNPETTSNLISRYEPEWPGLYSGKIKGFRTIGQSTYVRLLKDKSLNLKMQDQMIARLHRPDVVDIESGHMVMLSEPEKLAEVLSASILSSPINEV